MKSKTLLVIGIVLSVIGCLCWIVESAIFGSFTGTIGDCIATVGMLICLIWFGKDVFDEFRKR